jgi:thymidylate kinase
MLSLLLTRAIELVTMLKHEGTTRILSRIHGLIIEHSSDVEVRMRKVFLLATIARNLEMVSMVLPKIAANSVVIFHKKM